MGLDEPGQYCFLNRGISGNRIADLYARIKLDLVNLRPDVVSFHQYIADKWGQTFDREFRNSFCLMKQGRCVICKFSD